MNLDVRRGEVVGLAVSWAPDTPRRSRPFRRILAPRGERHHAARWSTVSSALARSAIDAGVVLVAEDRKQQSLVLGQSVRFNTSLATLGDFHTSAGSATRPNATRSASWGSRRHHGIDAVGGEPAEGSPREMPADPPPRHPAGRADEGHRRRCQGGDLRAWACLPNVSVAGCDR